MAASKAKLVCKIILFYPIFFLLLFPLNCIAFIFDTPLTDSNAVFKKNECFKTSSDLTTWLNKATSGVSYKRYVRPGFNESLEYNPPVQVNVSLDMNSMASVDEINSEYKIILKLDLEWVDERLFNNCSKSLVTMPLDSYHLDRIWSPKLGVPNIKDPDTSIIQGEATLILGQLRTDGYVHIRLNLLLNLFCFLDFKLFPFDKQECYIKLESRSFPRPDMILVWRKDHPFRNLESFLMTGFKLVGYRLYNDSTIAKPARQDIYGMNMMSQIMVKMVIQREWNNYFFEIYLPSMLFVMISWLSFWMQITAAPARVSLGMTTLLTLVTSSQSSRDKLPRIGYIHALDVWIAFCTCFIFLSLLEFALVSYIFRFAVNARARREQEEEERRAKKMMAERESKERAAAAIANLTDDYHRHSSSGKQHQQQQSHHPLFTVLGANHSSSPSSSPLRRGSILRQSSDTTDYSLPEGSQILQLVNKLNHISLTLPVNAEESGADVMTSRSMHQHQQKRGERKHGSQHQQQQFAISVHHHYQPSSSESSSDSGKESSPKATRFLCCMMWCSGANCQGEVFANSIDRKSRFVFPLFFILFNAVYWYAYTHLHQDITTKYNVVDPEL